MSDSGRYYGKYRGIVKEVDDPQNLGRVKAMVADVLGDVPSGWAMPSLPLAGRTEVFFVLPSIDSHVWIEFEGGDLKRPIWSGCFWEVSKELPDQLQNNPPRPGQVFLCTPGGLSILLDDAKGGTITLLRPKDKKNGQKIVISQDGVLISSGETGTILVGPNKTNINDGGLEVL
jgi:uncharacterized protein involved in type VI secretion and phage assembly